MTSSSWDTGWKNIVERFCWTAIQSFTGSLPATIALAPNDLKAVGWSGLTAAVASVISLAKNLTAEGVRVSAAKK